MQPSPAAVEVRKDEATRLYEALIDDQVVGTLAYETTGGRATLTHSYVDPDQRHRGIASALGAVSRISLRERGVGGRLAPWDAET
ncbi:GNAT family N-acetyltransferase [Streptomyces sp. NPDC006333]|uniref:GNAT family N-acetyltransferase n=1 Tax=Streptomyces sp. NPDC006333 TaxID=3156753 RepID=UPI0033A452EE